jgi:hypothetical protein
VSAAARDLGALLAATPEGQTLTLAPGRYQAGVALAHSVVIAGDGSGEVVLVAAAGEPVLRLAADGLDITLRDVTLAAAAAEVGAGWMQRGFSTARLERCVIRACRARSAPGDAVYVDAGTLTLHDCRVDGWGVGADALGEPGAGASPAALSVAGVGTLHAHACTLRGAAEAVVRVREEAEVHLHGCRVENVGASAALDVRGTPHQRPDVALVDCALLGEPEVAGDVDSRRRVRRDAAAAG